ncbi:MAG TPA: carboxypeptidase-like regulatory domain-containing protein [Pyrinomonadaceae bacterium]
MKLRLLVGLLVALVLATVYASFALNRSRRTRQYRGTSSHQEISQSSGAITGRVLDAEGQPMFNAKVQAFNTEFGTGKVPTAYTDEQGVFLIKNLKPGTYRLPVAKEGDGYPPTDSTFYSMDFTQPQQALVYEGQTTSDVVLHLGPKVAKLAGHIVDSTSHKKVLVDGVLITLRRVDNPDRPHQISTDENGEFEVLVPPVPTAIEVSAPGYEKKKLEALLLTRGEVKRLNIALHPAR